MQICINAPLPSLDGILSSFDALLKFPPALPELPSFILPSLPSPLFPDITIPNTELVIAAIEMQAFQLQKTILGMIKPMLDFLSIDIMSWLPKIPGLPNLNLMDLLAGKVDAIVAAVKAAILAGINLPFIPIPFYEKLVIPTIEVIHTMQMLVANYMQIIARMIPELIKKVTDKLKIPGLPTLPTLPSIEELKGIVMQFLKSFVPNIPNIGDLLEKMKEKGLELLEKLPMIIIPGFPPFPMIRLPFVLSIDIPEIDFQNALISFCNNLVMGYLKPILDFIMNTLKKFISFEFPLICVNIAVPVIPEMPAIPQVPPIRGL